MFVLSYFQRVEKILWSYGVSKLISLVWLAGLISLEWLATWSVWYGLLD